MGRWQFDKDLHRKGVIDTAKTIIQGSAYEIKRRFVVKHCMNKLCKDCVWYHGKCTHPDYPGTFEEMRKRRGERLI
jgi:hypothetical protein